MTTSTQKHPPNNTNDNPISTNLNISQNHSNSDHQQKLTSITMSDIHVQSMSNSSPSLYNSMHNPNAQNNMDVDQYNQQNQSQDSQLTSPSSNTINNSASPTESLTSPSNNYLSESDPNTNTDINMTDSSNIVTNIDDTEGTQDWTPVSHKKLCTSSPSTNKPYTRASSSSKK